jgi:[ribosomal protein S18]-alanine N-acetyltransferase
MAKTRKATRTRSAADPEITRTKGPHVQLQPLSQARAQEIVQWRYEHPYDFYNIDSENADRAMQDLLEPNNHCFEILDASGSFIGYCSFGPDGQVPGGDYSATALDVGMGIDPARTGKGTGSSTAKAVLEFARIQFAPEHFRVTIAVFNRRAIRVWQGLGFEPISSFSHALSGVEFVILQAEAPSG